jgi:hypothetical protein
MLLVPSDVLRPRLPDEHFAAEAAAACEAGLDVALIDHDALVHAADAEQAIARVRGGGEAVYRGWMMRGERYAALAEALARRDVRLVTSGAQYRRAHELPGWYPTLAAVTPPSVWTVDADRDSFDLARARLGTGPAVLRDYSKSMKHYWHEAAYIPELGDPDAAWKVASRFRQLRDDEFVGGFVLRRFEQLTSAEVRTWWVNGVCHLISAHPDTPDQIPPPSIDVAPFEPLIAALGLPFVTVDLALRTDDVWRIIELGDAQVSDRPTTTTPHQLVDALRALYAGPRTMQRG